jgi:type I restriction enzyme S subunit
LIKDGTHNPPQRVDYGVRLLSVRNIIDSEYVFRDDDSLISEESFRELNKYFQVKEGDVLLAIVGGTIGKTAIVKTMENHHIQRSLALFRTKRLKLIPEFLHYFMQSSYFYELLWSNVGFSAQPGIYLGSLANFKILAPSLNEQYDVVSFLKEQSQKFSLIVKETEYSIELLKEHRAALISAAVTGKIDVRNH